ncbi:ABC transporter permease [Roseimaritima sediminicola]|uniref:ABC transporter permease n=1 Tax=Roseimaritima sediminicola TaxID=2662066 RepID=UPI00129845EB|nr:FtsX-like permease family protein [Roseimaritima sediminicola]
MFYWRMAWRQIRRFPGRSAAMVGGIIIGVAAVIAVSLATQSTDQAFDAMFESISGRADLEVASAGGGSFDAEVLERIADTPGVQLASPLIQRPSILYFEDQRAKLITLGIDPELDQHVHPREIVAGRSLREDKGLLLEASLANSMGIEVDDAVQLLTRRGLIKARVIGLYRSLQTVATSGGASVLMSLTAAQYATKIPGRVNTIQIVVEPDADVAQVQAAIAAELPEALRIAPPAARSSLAKETAYATQQGMLTSRAFSLLVAVLIIANTFLISVTQRRRQIGILRAIGTTRRQVARMLYSEAILLGLVGAALGWLAGNLGAGYLARAMGTLFETEMPRTQWDPMSLLPAVLLGVGIALLGVWWPVRRASRLAPTEAMRESVITDFRRAWRWPTLLGVGLIILCSGVLSQSLQGKLPPIYSAWAGALLLSGLVLLVPLVTRPISTALSRLLRGVVPIESKLALQQLLRHHTRTSLTIGVLFVGLSTGVGMASSVIDNVADIRGWYRKAFVADLFLRAMSPDMATGLAADLPDEVGIQLAAVPHIRSLGTARFVAAEAAGQSVIVVASDRAERSGSLFDLTSGDPNGLAQRMAEGQVVIGSVLASRAGGLEAGDSLEIETEQGLETLPIAAVANDYMAGGRTVYMQRDLAERLLGVEGVDAYMINAQEGHLEAVRRDVRAIAQQHGLLLQTFSDIQRQIDVMMAGVVAGLWALVVLGFVVAAMGVANTLTMNVLEQTREIGLLRIVGTTGAQVRRSILLQGLMMGVIAFVPALAAGVLISYLTHLSAEPVVGHPIPFAIHPWLLAGSLVGGLVVIVAAAWFPARRAARLPLLKAIRHNQ